MSSATPRFTYEQLIEKVVRAQVKLESSRVSHSDSCPVESDPEGYAPCNCNASAVNCRIDAAIQELKL